MYSNEGPALAVTDLNADGNSDFFIGGGKNQPGSLFISSANNYQKSQTVFEKDSRSEDTDALFFDGDNDGDLDLYVCHGGKAFSPYASSLNDQYYRNDRNQFSKTSTPPKFPKAVSSSVAVASDYDQDGDIDLFVGERYKTSIYGIPGSGYLLENDGNGYFKATVNESLADLGMITDAQWVDLNCDGWQDLVIIGEWMPIKIFLNENGRLVDKSNAYQMKNTSGLWSALHITDVDNDGDQDLVVGNMGLNNFFEPNMRMYVGDFDQNGFSEQLICKKVGDQYYPIVDKDELISQIPSLKKKLLYYKDYAKASVSTIFSEELLAKMTCRDIQLLESTIFFNEENSFKAKPLPSEIQYAPVYAITSEDINDDATPDLFFGGNQYLVKPQFGRYDASKGWVIFGPSTLNENKEEDQKNVAPLYIDGQIRDLKWVEQDGKKILVAVKNNEKVNFYAN